MALCNVDFNLLQTQKNTNHKVHYYAIYGGQRNGTVENRRKITLWGPQL